MRYLSVCSGIEAASCAWHPLGWKPVAFSEIDPSASAIIAHRFPNTPNLGDMTKFKDWPNYESIDVLVGGTPCQSFSLAGLRKGLADPRGNLCLTFLAIVAKYRPEWVVWENVPGVHSSWTDVADGRASQGAAEVARRAREFGIAAGLDAGTVEGCGGFEEADQSSDFDCFLGGLADLGYGTATRIFDAQYFGLAQRRERVFVVGCLGGWQGAAAVLFERAGLSGNPPPRREARKGTAGTLSARTSGGGGLGTDFDLAGGLQARSGGADENDARDGRLVSEQKWPADVAPTLNAHFGDKQGLEDQHALNGAGLFVPAKPIYATSGQHNAAFAEDKALALNSTNEPPCVGIPAIVVALTAKGAPANGAPEVDAGHYIPQAFNWQSGGDCRGLELKDVSQPLTKEQTPAVLHLNGTDVQEGGAIANPVTAGNGKQPDTVVAFSAKDHGADAGDIAPTLRSGGHKDSHANGGVMPAVAFQEAQSGVAEYESAGTLRANGPGHDPVGTRVRQGMAVRRLMPVECERLQGFPDNWTLVPKNGKPMADGPRYKMLGNSMPVPVMAWIGRKIAVVDQLLKR